MKGPRKQFDSAHVLRCLLILEREKRIGRKELTKRLVLGEGSVRSILKDLSKKGYLKSAVAKGHELSTKGWRFVKELNKSILGPRIISAKGLTVGEKDVAILVKNVADRVKIGLDERDAAIKIGSLGATILVFKNNELKFPDQTRLKIKNNDLYRLFDFKEEDVLIIGTDNTYDKAENAAIAALFALVGDKIIIS